MQIEIIIIRATVAGGKAVAPGDKILASPGEATLLTRLGKAVVNESATETASAEPGADPATEDAVVTPKRKK